MQVQVIDLEIGNLGNVERALRHLGAEVKRATSAVDLQEARVIVLPGVGAFRPPRERLRGELEEALRGRLEAGAWLLGICVGFQLLFESSSEFGQTDGLALLPGTVERLPEGVELPHMGWNRLRAVRANDPLLEGLEEGGEPFAYFVHSYAPAGVPGENVLLETDHGRTFAAGVARGRVCGYQFHPEKSGDVGLRLLRNFLELAGEEA